MRQHIKNKKNNIKSVARLSENVWLKKVGIEKKGVGIGYYL